MKIRIALAQVRCEKGAVEENSGVVGRCYADAVARDASILACPEMCLTGYNDPARYPEAILRLDGPEVTRLVHLTQGHNTALLAGLIEANPAGKPYITHVVARGGALAGFYRKVTIQDEEVEWFSPGESVPVFEHDGLTFGIAICADIDNREVFAGCARQGARVVFEVAAPGLYGEQATRDWRAGFEWWRGECTKHLAQYARDFSVWIPVCTQAGRTVDENFPGGGFLFAPDGTCAYETPDWEEGVCYVEAEV